MILYTSASGEGQTKRSRERKATLENDIVRMKKEEKEQSDSERVKHHERESEARWRARVGARMERIEQKSLILAQDERWRRA